MHQFFSLVIYLGLVKPYAARDLWMKDCLHNHLFPASVMPGYRFEATMAYLHMSDLATDAVLTACRALYHPHENISIDERMVATKAKIGMKQYMKDKLTKCGYKLFVLADSSNGYTCGFQIYEAKAMTPSGQGLSFDSVVGLLHVPYLGTGYKVYVDIFYTSSKLFRHLYSIGFGVCGTIQEGQFLARGEEEEEEQVEEEEESQTEVEKIQAKEDEEGTMTGQRDEKEEEERKDIEVEEDPSVSIRAVSTSKLEETFQLVCCSPASESCLQQVNLVLFWKAKVEWKQWERVKEQTEDGVHFHTRLQKRTVAHHHTQDADEHRPVQSPLAMLMEAMEKKPSRAPEGLMSAVGPSDINTGDWFSVVYDYNWWLAKVLKTDQEHRDVQVEFFHPHGPSSHFQRKQGSQDVCYVPFADVIVKHQSSPVRTSRSREIYQLSPEVMDFIDEELFNRLLPGL
ncbi:hypothetical protein ACEWY4_006160 [Coilia grayii]|uniref:PiggyBac transposable element-derived protein domain-containing protein n=1 Tax=Coilia grayii TaxID=363190 RepID=A0ABD1KCY1_9TELE